MATSLEPHSSDLHQIECHGDHSYWVIRYPEGDALSGRTFSRVVYFARDQRDAENYIRRYRRLRR